MQGIHSIYKLPSVVTKLIWRNVNLSFNILHWQVSEHRVSRWSNDINIMQYVFPSERQEQQVLRGVITGPSSIRLTWRNIPSSQGYRLEWREGEGQTCMSRAWTSLLIWYYIAIYTCHMILYCCFFQLVPTSFYYTSFYGLNICLICSLYCRVTHIITTQVSL